MTKIHEEFVSGTIAEVLEVFEPRESIYGEITIVFATARREQQEIAPETIHAEFERLRASGMRRNDAVKVIAEKFGMRKNDVYKLLL
jgi:16S rRNA (cytidine1402-2'-O)-methyltransferase